MWHSYLRSLISNITPVRVKMLKMDKFKNDSLAPACLIKTYSLFFFFKFIRYEIDVDGYGLHIWKNGAACIDQAGNYCNQWVPLFKGNKHEGRRKSKHN